MELIKELIIVFSIATAVIYLCSKIKLPSVVGFLITGILAGPHGFSLMGSTESVNTLSEIGIVLLLFTIGLEFSLKSLNRIRRTAFLGGTLQVTGVILLTYVIFTSFGMSKESSIFYGFLFSLSSTAIVLKILQEKSEMYTPHGKATLAVLIFQDLIAVPMMLFIPFLSGSSGYSGKSALILLAKGVGFIVLVIVLARFVIPRVLYGIAKTRSKELFLMGIVVICFSIAWLTSWIGLSMALGAFTAGLVISQTEYSHEAIGNAAPFRDIFTAIFFISIGMLLDAEFIIKNPVKIISASAVLIAIKTLLSSAAFIPVGLPIRNSIIAGIALSQVGEFSFILSKAGLESGLIRETDYQIFLTVSVLTMMAAPFTIKFSGKAGDLAAKFPLPNKIMRGIYAGKLNPDSEKLSILKDHLIIIGFGINGQHLASSAKLYGIPYVIIEMNPETVKRELKKGEFIFYGDASHEEVLHHAKISSARTAAIAIPDAAMTRRIITTAKKLNSFIHIITRTRFMQEVDSLYSLGADQVVTEEFETSVEIFTRVLSTYNIPWNDIAAFTDRIRSDAYSMLRKSNKSTSTLSSGLNSIPGVEFLTYRVEEGSFSDGKTLQEMGVRSRYKVTVIAIYRGDVTFHNPSGDMRILAGDVILLLGKQEDIFKSLELFMKRNILAGERNPRHVEEEKHYV